MSESQSINNSNDNSKILNDYAKILNDRIHNLESSIIDLQKGIDNLQYNFSVQVSQTQFIKARNRVPRSGTNII
jgi:prefoldin subunit 5